MTATKLTAGARLHLRRASFDPMPYPAIDKSYVLLAIRAIEAVAKGVTENLPIDFWDTKWEEPLTRAIQVDLVNQLGASGEERLIPEGLESIFNAIDRDAAYAAEPLVHDPDSGFKPDRKDLIATEKDRRCDIVFKFARTDDTMSMDRTHRFLTIEAKRIPETPTELTDYGNKGIARFVHGLYAMSERQAVMLGYVRKATAPYPQVLDTYLARPSTRWLHPHKESRKTIDDGQREMPVVVTRHDRKWTYPVGSRSENRRPGPIDLYHAWIQLL